MSGQVMSPEIFDLDEIVERFEDQMADAGDARIEDFVPAPGHPAYLGVLGELIRVDLEHRWNRGQPVALGEYARRFPQAFAQPVFVAPLAFEEFRVRRSAGQLVSREEYQREYQVDVSSWPAEDSTQSSGLIPAIEIPPEGLSGEESFVDSAAGAPLTSAARDMSGSQARSAPSSAQDLTGFHGSSSAQGSRRSASDLSEIRSAGSGSIVRPQAGSGRGGASQVRSQVAQQERALKELASLQPGAHFLGFDLVAELGRGAVGRVYLARQRHLANRRVVLKVTTEPTVEPDRLASLQHTNVVPIYSFHRSSALHVVCMPYLGSCVLKQWVDHLRQNPGLPRDQSRFVTTLAKLSGSTIPQAPRESRPVSAGPLSKDAPELSGELPESGVFRLRGENYPSAVLWLGARLAEGLAHAHEKGVLHLDIKPGNILLTDFGQPMLLDFHLARSSRVGSPGSRQVGGTIPYMGPEHLRCLVEESDIDPRADVYSLGVVLFEMLTGQLPFPSHHGALAQILPRLLADRQQVPGLRNLNPQVSPATEAIVQRCLHPDPNQRYQSAEQLLEDLESQLRHQPLRFAGNPSWQEGLSKWARRHPRVTSAGGISLIATSVVLLLISGLLARDYQVKTLQARRVADLFEAEAPLHKSALAMSVLEPNERSRDIARTETALSELGLIGQFSHASPAPLSNPTRAFAAGGPTAHRMPAEVEFPARPAPLDWAAQRPFALLEPAQRDRLAKVASEVLFALAATQATEAESLVPAQRSGASLGTQQNAETPVSLTLNLETGECVDEVDRAARACVLWHQALANNTRAIQYCPATSVPVGMWRQRAHLLVRLSQAGTAREVQELAQRAGRDGSPDRPLEALEELTKSEFMEAGRLFEGLCDQTPDDPSAWFLTGIICWHKGQFQQAEACLNAALALRPDWDRPWVCRAAVRIHLQKYREALSDCEQAVLLNPSSRNALRNRAIAHDRLGEYPKALADLTTLLERDDSETRILRLRSQIYQKLGQTELANADLERFLGTRPKDAHSWNNRGALKLAKKDVAGALADFQAACDSSPHDLDSYMNQAAVLTDYLHQPDEAVRILGRGLEVSPGSPKLLASRAVLLAREGKRELALQDIERALQVSREPLIVYQAACVDALTLPEEDLARPETLKLLADAFHAQPGLALIALGDQDLARLKSLDAFNKLVAAGQVMGQAIRLIRP